MKSRLENGDILVELDEVIDEPLELKKDLDEDTTKEMIDAIASKSFHGLIYTQEEIKSDNSSEHKHIVYHSSEGQRFGITEHSIIKPLFPHSLNENQNLPTTIVFRCKNKKIGENLVLAANRWASLKKIVPAPKDSTKFFQSTPFASERMVDNVTDEVERLFELYRAFRAQHRNHNSLPLSEKKGASCSNFINYSLKVGIIDYLFPQGVPCSIQKKLAEIEQKKDPKDSKKEGLKIRRLIDIHNQHPNLFEEFEALVVEEYNKNDKAKSEKDIFNFLYQPIKAKAIGDFCRYVSSYPSLIAVSGYLLFKVGELTPDDHKKLSELKPNEKSKDCAGILASVKKILPGELKLTDLELLIKLSHQDRLEKSSRNVLRKVLARVIAPTMLHHDNYFKLLEANDLSTYPYVVPSTVFEGHVKKAMEAKAESPRPSL